VPLDDGSDLYDDPDLYDLEHAGYAGDVAWYLGLCRRLAIASALELGCGTGRLLRPLARAGVHIVGVDCSPAMIARCQAGLDELDAGARTRGSCRVADARTLLAQGQDFDLVVAAFNTLQHVAPCDLDAVLATVAAQLRPGGHFACDLYAPARELAAEGELEDTHEAVDARGQAWSAVRTRRWHGPGWLESRFTVEVRAGDVVRSRPARRLPQYQWSRAELCQAMPRHGLVLVDEAGDLDGRAWSPSSPRWLALWRRAPQPA
jgi:SAM-dependent methyltransferase